MLAVLWWRYSAPDTPREWAVPALFLLLLLALASMLAMPFVLVAGRRLRWLLIMGLSAGLLYWGLRWIEAFALAPPGDADYAAARRAIPAIMALTALGTGLLYALLDRLPPGRATRPGRGGGIDRESAG